MRFLKIVIAAVLVATAAHAAPPPLTAYGRLPAISAVALSPTGERFALAAADPNGGWNVIVRTAAGAPVAAVVFKVANIRRLEFAGDDELLIFETALSDTDRWLREPGFERTDVMVFNIKTRTSYLMLQDSGVVRRQVFGWGGVGQAGGRWYAYIGAVPVSANRSLREQGIYPDLFRVDLETGKPELVQSAGGRPHGDWLVSPQGQLMATTIYEPNAERWTAYAGAGAQKPVLERQGADALALVSLGRSPGSILALDRSNETTTFREIGADGKTSELASGEELVGAITDRETGRLVGLSTFKDQVLFDPALQARLQAAREMFPADRVRLVDHGRNFDRMLLFTEGPRNPGSFWLADSVAHRVVPLGEVRPEVAADQVGPSWLFSYKAADGLALEGVLTVPTGRDPRKLPLVVMPHTGPFADGDHPGFNWWAQAFASRGYAVFQPNFRGSLGYGDTFRAAGNGEIGRKMQSDLSDGVAALAAAGYVDPSRVCIVGWSYGGYAALAGVTLQHGVYRCAVSVAGFSDIDQMVFWLRERSSLSNSVLLERRWRTITGTGIGASGAISPLKKAASADAPILLMHGENDRSVPIEQSRSMNSALSSARKTVEFVTLKDAVHNLDTAVARQAVVDASVAFVQKHNPAD
jgi:dipeptidyl aminopeptidase/acylaminoacyl peptidase